jgi:cyclopropane fatty-acyl-phospholipid synthase-like methyltransferase
MKQVFENIPFSAACERNKEDILTVITLYLLKAQTVLEIGTGTAQHAVYFAKKMPHLSWQTSDQEVYLNGINAQLKAEVVANVIAPLKINVNQNPWVFDNCKYDLIYTSNTFHIMSQNDVGAFFNGVSQVLNDNAYLVVYGPFKYDGKFTSDSNFRFDQSLRSRECGSAIKDFEVVNDLAEKQGFVLLKDQSMPANNQCLVWQKNGNSAL